MIADRLDHVALWVGDHDAHAAFCTEHLGMHVIERTDAFALVGTDARRGKLTFFAADGGRTWHPLERVTLHCPAPEALLDRLPPAAAATRADDGTIELDGPDGLRLALGPSEPHHDGDLARVTLAVADPGAARAAFVQLGFAQGEDGTLTVGDSELMLIEDPRSESGRPSHLNHLALLVDSAATAEAEARALGFAIDRTVDAANTRAVFVWGPERILVEYVEHKSTFALT
jgi:catechol 2,3-dioxygenase-like lactoylglutathione lyase family enzyme